MANGIAGYPGGLEQRGYPGEAFPGFPAAFKRISWGAVFAGLIVVLMISLVLALLGTSIGLGTVNPQEEQNPFAGLGMGAGIWWVVSSLIALFLGGLMAGRLAGLPKRFDGALHGILTWGLASLLTFYLLSTAVGKLVGGVSAMVGKGVSAAGQGAAAMAPEAAAAIRDQLNEQGITLDRIKEEAAVLMRQTGKPELQPGAVKGEAEKAKQQTKGAAGEAAQNPQAADQEMGPALSRVLSQAKGTVNAMDREAVINILVARGQGKEEAARTVDGWIATAREAGMKVDQARAAAGQKAREWGGAAASGMSKASLVVFIALVLGAVAAAFGGALGSPRILAAETRPA